MSVRDEWIIIRTIGENHIQVEAHFDPQAETYNVVTTCNGRIVDVGHSDTPFAEAQAQIEDVVCHLELATIEPSRALDGAEHEAQ